MFGERLSSSRWARELSSLLSTSVAAWLKTQREAALFSSTNTFSSKSRSASVVNGLLATEHLGCTYPPLLLGTQRCAIFKCLPFPMAQDTLYLCSTSLFTMGIEKCLTRNDRFVKVSIQDLNPKFSPKVDVSATILCTILYCANYEIHPILSKQDLHCQMPPPHPHLPSLSKSLCQD